MAYGKLPKLGVPSRPMQQEVRTAYGFEQALVWLKGNRKITRRGWNGQGMWIYLVDEREVRIGETYETEMLVGVKAQGLKMIMAARIDMQYANGKIGIWTPTPEDILAEDWIILS